MCDALHYRLDNIFIRYGSKLYRQIIGMFCCTLLYVHSSIAIILMGKKELDALLNLSPWCHMMVEWLFLALQWGCLRFVIVVFPDHTHLLFQWELHLLVCSCCRFVFFYERDFMLSLSDNETDIIKLLIPLPDI